ncbi:hypothetical protein M0R45_005979 [Rubus argutus]|uniref:Uncharacterized protein n=1 Tax=Rubus argutus TaxID=59490 RepID=A0AAW1YP44_RUBAR
MCERQRGWRVQSRRGSRGLGGRGTLSLVSQLKEPKFSYCLTSVDNTQSTSTLLMGELPGDNYMIADSETSRSDLLGCWEAPAICLCLGNYQQQNILVLHDLVKETISFVPTKCDQL